MRGGVGCQCVQADRLHPAALRQGDGLADHLRADAGPLPVRPDGEDMDNRHLVVSKLPRPLYRVIVLPLVHRDCHGTDDVVTLPVEVQTAFSDIGLDAVSRRVLSFLPAGMGGHLGRSLCDVLVECQDGLEIRYGCLMQYHMELFDGDLDFGQQIHLFLFLRVVQVAFHRRLVTEPEPHLGDDLPEEGIVCVAQSGIRAIVKGTEVFAAGNLTAADLPFRCDRLLDEEAGVGDEFVGRCGGRCVREDGARQVGLRAQEMPDHVLVKPFEDARIVEIKVGSDAADVKELPVGEFLYFCLEVQVVADVCLLHKRNGSVVSVS